MGITIENSIRLLEDCHKWEKEHGLYGSGVDDATSKLIGVAKKYLKIQKIINDYESEGWERIAVSDIKEVLEDDKV